MNDIITTTGRSLTTITAEIKALTEQAQIYVLNTTIELGRRLTEAKALIPAGESWLDYLTNEVSYSKSTAENFMRIFREYGDDQQSLFGGNSQALRKLTYTKALALLAIPREDREEFAEEVDAENLSTRELTEAIEARKKAEQDAKTAQMDADGARQLAALAQEQATEAASKVEQLTKKKNAAESELADIKKHVNKLQADLEKADKEAAAAKRAKPEVSEDMMTQLRAEAEAAAAEEAQKHVADQLAAARRKAEAAENQAALLRAELEKAQKTAVMGSPDMAVFAQLFQQVQEDYNKLCGSILKIKAADPEQAGKLVNAVSALLDKMGKKIKGEQ